MLVILSGCVPADPVSGDSIPANYPTIASPTVQGRFEIVELSDDGGAADLAGPVTPTVAFDVVTGELRIETGCNQYLGSFTLDPDGRASFTVAGGTREQCPDGQELERQTLDAFGRIDGWTEVGDGLELTGLGSTVIRLRRV